MYLTQSIVAVPTYTVGSTILELKAEAATALNVANTAKTTAETADTKAATAQGEVDALETLVANQVLSQEFIDAAQQAVLDASGSVIVSLQTTQTAQAALIGTVQSDVTALNTNVTELGDNINALATETNNKFGEVNSGMVEFKSALDALFV